MIDTATTRIERTQALPTEYALEAHEVTRSFRVEGHRIDVLKGASLSVRYGEWVALVGPSGCGKTTFLHILGTLDRPNGGRLFCRGRACCQLRARRAATLRREEIGMIFQAYHLLPELSALENVVLPALRGKVNKAVFRRRAAELLDSFGLGNRLNHLPQELSGGEQQRVAMARALINDPDILLADEPTGNLDGESSGRIINIVERLHKEQQKTIVMVTHDRELANRADRVVRLVDGKTETT